MTKQMTKQIVILTALMNPSVYATGIPVVDVAGGIINEAGFSAQIAKTVDQITNWKKQYSQMEKDYIAVSGIKDAVSFYKDIKKLTKVMEDFKVTFDDLDLKNPKSQIGAMAKQIFNENKIFDNCNVDYFTTLQKGVCENNQLRNVKDLVTATQYSEALDKTTKRLEDLSEKLANSEDIKTSQDVSNAISLEIAKLDIFNAKVRMMENANIASKKADSDRLEQENDKNLGVTTDKSAWFK